MSKSNKDNKDASKITPESLRKEKPQNEVVESEVQEVVQKEVATPAQRVASRARAQEQRLEKEDKVQIIIPLGPGEEAGKATTEVGINGYVRIYPKGVFIDVPKSVAVLITQSYNLTSQVGKEFEINKNNRRYLS